MGNFIGMVYSQLKEAGVDTSDMDTNQAIDKWNAMQEKEGKFGSDKPTDAESKRMKEMGIEDDNDKIKDENILDDKELKMLPRMKKEVIENNLQNLKELYETRKDKTSGEQIKRFIDAHEEELRNRNENTNNKVENNKTNEEKTNSKYLTEKEKDKFIENEYDKDINTEVNSWDDEFKSKMLGRMVADVDYWIDTGKTEGGYKHLWAKDPKIQAKYMEKIFNSMNSDDIDLTREDLEYYKKELLSK